MRGGKILIAIDLSDVSRTAMEAGALLAKDLGAKVVLVHAVSEWPRVPAYAASVGASYEDLDDMQRRHIIDEATAVTTDWASQLRKQGLDVTVVVDQLDVVDLILDTAKEHDAQMIVMGTHGWSGIKRFIMGSVAQRVLHDADRPVLIVPPLGSG